jgi:hypothetical protein
MKWQWEFGKWTIWERGGRISQSLHFFLCFGFGYGDNWEFFFNFQEWLGGLRRELTFFWDGKFVIFFFSFVGLENFRSVFSGYLTLVWTS